jgi:hypothetical protein
MAHLASAFSNVCDDAIEIAADIFKMGFEFCYARFHISALRQFMAIPSMVATDAAVTEAISFAFGY